MIMDVEEQRQTCAVKIIGAQLAEAFGWSRISSREAN
jgi:hypothetical protein